MQLLDSCPLPQAQFASLSILIQLRLDDDDNDDGGNQTDNDRSRSDAMMPSEEEESAAAAAGPAINDDAKNNNNVAGEGIIIVTEADKSAGPPPPPPTNEKAVLSRAVLKECMTVLSPLTLLPEEACRRSTESLQNRVMEDFGFRDDFTGMGVHGGGEGGEEAKEEGGNATATKGTGEKNNDNNNNAPEEEEDESPRRSSRVRFHDDTKEGAAQDPAPTDAPSSKNANANNRYYDYSNNDNLPFGSMLPVETYRPPRHRSNCSLGLTMFYTAVYVEDISKLSSFASDDEKSSDANNNSSDDAVGGEEGAMKALRNCASVLLPGIPVESLLAANNSTKNAAPKSRNNNKQGGIMLLTVGTTGPAYDLYGASSAFATLPERLRESMAALAGLNTTPKEAMQQTSVANNNDNRMQQQLLLRQGSKKKKGRGGRSSPSKPALSVVTTQPVSRRRVIYDAAYFRRLYTALLATLIDDEDGLLVDHDEIIATTTTAAAAAAAASSMDTMSPSYNPALMSSSTAAIVGSPMGANKSFAESASPLMANQSVTSSGTVRKKRFTFSRTNKKGSSKNKGNNKGGDYESGETISGGDDPLPTADDEGDSRADNAEMVRRTAQQLEVLSIAEDDMDLPRYARAAEGGGGGRRTTATASSPRRGSSAAASSSSFSSSSSGRFGRRPVPSDLTGFEYRPPVAARQQQQQQQQSYHPPGSVSGTASTSVMGASDDVASVASGDDGTIASRYTVGSLPSQASVPTLSKSKRDMGKGGVSSRSRFLRRKKQGMQASPKSGGGAAAAAVAKSALPPRFPQQQQQRQQPSPPSQQLVYDPFSMDEEEEDDKYDEDNDSKTTERTSESIQSVPSESSARDDDAARGSAPRTPEEPEDRRRPDPSPHSSPVVPRPDPSPYSSPSMTPQEEAEDEIVGVRGDLPPSSSSTTPLTPRSLSSLVTRESSEGATTEDDDGASSIPESAASIATESVGAEESASASVATSIATEEEEGRSMLSERSGAASEAAREYNIAQPEETMETAQEVAEPTRHLEVGLALNEDLTCEYKRSKLSSLTVEGTVQVRVRTRYKDDGSTPQQQQSPPIPFLLVFQDHSGHMKALQENKKFVENITHENNDDVVNREFTYTIKVPREEEYFPVVRYKCGSSLRPVPIRVQSRIRIQGRFVRIALQISSNPQNPSDLVHLTIIMNVPPQGIVKGETLQCNPAGGVWNESKRVVLWCVSELGGGEKFQLQSIFELDESFLKEHQQSSGGRGDDDNDMMDKLEFPVLARCQCAGGQLSDVALEVMGVDGDMFPAVAGVSKSVVQRFRVSHKESNR